MKRRRRPVHLHVMVSEEEQALIRERMDEAGIRNMGAYMRKMALNGRPHKNPCKRQTLTE